MSFNLDIRVVLGRLIVLLVLGLVFQLSSELPANEGLSEADLRRVHKELRDQPACQARLKMMCASWAYDVRW